MSHGHISMCEKVFSQAQQPKFNRDHMKILILHTDFKA